MTYNYDLHSKRHLSRAKEEDYQFLIDNGASHERALIQIGMTEREWARLQETNTRRRERHGDE